MGMTRTEELTLSLARSATGRAGDGQIVALLVSGLCLAGRYLGRTLGCV